MHFISYGYRSSNKICKNIVPIDKTETLSGTKILVNKQGNVHDGYIYWLGRQRRWLLSNYTNCQYDSYNESLFNH